MKVVSLTKHHGLGNDFLVALDPPDAFDAADLAARLCDRTSGIGADGLIAATAGPDGGVRMVLHNADGSRAEMSGNGIRCLAQAVARRRGSLDQVSVLTDAGHREVALQPTSDPETVLATVDMGAVSTIAAPPGWDVLGVNPDRPVAHLGLGNPHAVVGVDDVASVDLLALGSQVPDVNLEVVEPGPEPHAVTMRVHERGAGITAACGTGACAAAWAAAEWGFVPQGTQELVVHMDGGSAKVALHRPRPGHVTLTGPATFIASIEVTIP